MRLRSVSERLTGFLQSSEAGFLHMGLRVQELERGVRDLLELSKRVGALDAGGSDPVAKLRGELDRVEAHLGTSRSMTLQGETKLPTDLHPFSPELHVCAEGLAKSQRSYGKW
jgi:hypothetical protein